MNKQQIIRFCADTLPDDCDTTGMSDADILLEAYDITPGMIGSIPDNVEAEFCEEYDPFDFSGFEGTPMPGTHVQRGKLWLVGKVEMMGHPTLCHFLFTMGA